MTKEILTWLETQVTPLIEPNAIVHEVGSLNINGSARDVIPHSSWFGWDITEGPCVDIVGPYRDYGQACDMIIACESLEHDRFFWLTIDEMHRTAYNNGALMVITTPTIAFPYHSYGGDFYRFTEDTYRQLFFRGFHIYNFATVGSPPFTTNCCVGKPPSKNGTRF